MCRTIGAAGVSPLWWLAKANWQILGAVTQTSLSPDRRWWWTGTAWVSARSADGRWRWNGHRWQPVTRPWVWQVALTALILGFFGVMVGGFGFMDSCLPGSWPNDPGSYCYSPPWATPALILGTAAVVASVLGLTAAGLGYLHPAARSPRPPNLA